MDVQEAFNFGRLHLELVADALGQLAEAETAVIIAETDYDIAQIMMDAATSTEEIMTFEDAMLRAGWQGIRAQAHVVANARTLHDLGVK